jgi:uncharacterized protein YutD
MKTIKLNEMDYEVIEDKDGYDEKAITDIITDYFVPYDYIIGDWAYNKLRLKGFCDKNNKAYNQDNDIQNKEKYIKNNCAYGCKYFVLKKKATE